MEGHHMDAWLVEDSRDMEESYGADRYFDLDPRMPVGGEADRNDEDDEVIP